MPLATGVVTKTVTFGPFKDYLGNPAQGGRVTFRASTDLYWAATGEVLLADTKIINVDFDAEGWIVLPAVDQAGFTTQDGSAITLWTYKVTRTLIMTSGEIRVLPEKSFQIYESDPATIDLESVVGVESSGGVIVPAPVTSVAGLVGSITGASLMLALGAAPLTSPALTGTPTAPTASGGTSTTQIATTAFVAAAVTSGTVPDATTSVKGKALLGAATGAATFEADALKAPLASPTFTGVPAGPTAAGGTSTTQLATTAFVAAAVGSPPAPPFRAVTATTTLVIGDANGVVSVNSGSASNVTIPANSSVAFANGTSVEIGNIGAGVVTVLDNTTGTPVTVTTLSQGQSLFCRKYATDTWLTRA